MSKEVRILIVEDEFMISEDIAMRLEDFGYLVAGTAPSAEQALEILEEGQIDLALLDVNIEGEVDGIELSKIIAEKYKIPFIFLTSLASSQVIERAKECNPSAYLLKPFNDRQVQIAIEMALENFSENIVVKEAKPIEEKPTENKAVLSINDSLFLRKDSHFERVRFKDILYLAAESNYTIVYTSTGKYMYSCILKKFENRLPADTFYRVHRSYIVNVNWITGFEGNSLFLEGRKVIPISKTNRDELNRIFKIV